MDTVIIKTPCGEIKGEKLDGAVAFKGIKYASAERFAYPVVTKSWQGVFDATEFGDCCWQGRAILGEDEQSFYYKEFRKDDTYTYSEDCLNLNLYAPVGKTGCPVVVFVHGGNFFKGSNNERPMRTTAYAKHDVVFVSVNYRLGVFGFINADGAGQNLALHDLTAAVEWLKENVEAFGGDPERIVLIGQSAGAMCIQSLILSPTFSEKVSGAVMMSGGGLLSGVFAPVKEKRTRKFWLRVLKAAGVNSAEEAKQIPAEKLWAAWHSVGGIGSLMATKPVIDGKIVQDKLKNEFAKVTPLPTVIGMVERDMTPSILRSAQAKYQKLSKERGGNCFTYCLKHNLPGDDKGTFHSADLWYALGAFENCWRPFADEDMSVADEMQRWLCHFFRGEYDKMTDKIF